MVILYITEGIIAEGWRFGDAVLGSAEPEQVTITGETPVAEARDIKTDVTAVLIPQPRCLGKSVPRGIVEERGVIAV